MSCISVISQHKALNFNANDLFTKTDYKIFFYTPRYTQSISRKWGSLHVKIPGKGKLFEMA